MKEALFLSAMAAAGFLSLPSAAAPAFAPVLQDHMVLQRHAPVTLWGTADEGETITVEWKGQKMTSPVVAGQWKVTFPASAADATGSTITATDSSGCASLSNVLVGDVWLASGQSNMEWSIRQTPHIPPGVNVNNPHVRLLKGSPRLFSPPEAYSDGLYREASEGRDYEWSWRPCTAESIQDFSAVATYFATCLQEELHLPIGIICNARGGSPMEAWLPPALLSSKPCYDDLQGRGWLSSPDLEKWVCWRAGKDLAPQLARGETNLQHPFAPGYLYRNGIEPIAPLALCGVIWYQGEANADTLNTEGNVAKLKDLILSWRGTFRQPDLPFLMVQLPRINAEKQRPYWAEFREAQARVARELPQVGLICTIDLGTTDRNVHPPLKHPVGFRLANLARSMVYGAKGLPSYPLVTSWKAMGDHFVITFDQELCTTDGQAPRGFVVGQANQRGSFAEAAASLSGNTIILSLPSSQGGDDAWRYINTTFASPNLVGAVSGLPAFPARSDTEWAPRSPGSHRGCAPGGDAH